MKKIVNTGIALAFVALPTMAFAQNFTYIELWISRITSWVNQGVTFLMVVATLFFIWSVITYIRDKGDKPEDTKKKKNAMIQGIVGLAVIIGIWGIINIINGVFGIGTGGSPAAPCAPGQTFIRGIGCTSNFR